MVRLANRLHALHPAFPSLGGRILDSAHEEDRAGLPGTNHELERSDEAHDFRLGSRPADDGIHHHGGRGRRVGQRVGELDDRLVEARAR